MRSYKISQIIEKSAYPIEAKLDMLRESNQDTLNKIIDVYAPAFLSALLTTILGYSVIPITDSTIVNQPSWLAQTFDTLWGKILFLLLSFIVFSFVIFGICRCLNSLSQHSDNKKTKDQRKRIAKEFYKVIVNTQIKNLLNLLKT